MSKARVQFGGGNCSLCGAPGVTKVSCPANPNATKPNQVTHPNAQVALAIKAKTPVKKDTPNDIFVGIIKIKPPNGDLIFDFTMISKDQQAVRMSVNPWKVAYPDILKEFLVVRTKMNITYIDNGLVNEKLVHHEQY
jgi:hypothetical protein